MIKVGITGQSGFIGQHLFNTLGLYPQEFERVPFNRDFFKDENLLLDFVSECDVIVHLAAMNRHNDPKVIYNKNIQLVESLVSALDKSGKKPHVLFSSSSQEERDNHYGRSKKLGRQFLQKWSERSGASFSGIIIPNVFGPFGHPYYNSFIATFCHQLTHKEEPHIEVDGNVKLIYVDELIQAFITQIRTGSNNDLLYIPHTSEYKVSEILNLLESYKKKYFTEGIIPRLSSSFEVNLFNTFRSYFDIKTHYPVKFIKNTDPRGTFVEIIRLSVGGQFSFSTTLQGVTRGNHYHTRKIERFAVIKGKALIQLRRIGTDEILDFYLDGENPAYVDMPVWYTHNIKNIGEDELYTNFWINEFYDPNDPDTYMETV
jgi:UDP-2-acetamido-2,6-beta-L-arabino-hexul-4-ose reductase